MTVTIKTANINYFGDYETFTGTTLDDAIKAMESAIAATGEHVVYDGVLKEGTDYEVVEELHRGFVVTEDGIVLVQLPDADAKHGFLLCDDDQTWDGGLGVATEWTPVEPNDPRISAADHDRLDWLLQ